MFLSYQTTEEHCNSNLWLLDIGCSNHKTSNKSLLSCLDSFIITNIKLRYDFLVLGKGKGSVPIFRKKNEKKYIHEFFYVPHLNVNLINIGQLIQNQYDIWFYDTYCVIYHKPPGKKLIAKVEMTKNEVFALSLRNSNLPLSVAHIVSSLDESWLWHSTFGHIMFKSLNLQHK